jgi:hypothetical protein
MWCTAEYGAFGKTRIFRPFTEKPPQFCTTVPRVSQVTVVKNPLPPNESETIENAAC